MILALLPVGIAAQNAPATPLTQTTTTSAPEPIERQIRKTVTFITLTCLRGNTPIQAQGTGFFVSVADSRLPANRTFVYLVTNRHVAMCWDDQNNPMQVQSVTIRMNLKDGSSKELPSVGNLAWTLPSDDSVDLALVPAAFDLNVYNLRLIPDSLLVTEDVIKKESIAEGLKLVFSGFFYQVPGLKQIEPILREGIVAMMPDEELVTTTGKKGKVYLGEVHAFHGNSGSPAFVDLGGLRGGSIRAGADYRLLGVVSGGYSEGEQNTLVLETPLASKPGNSGIAMIVPASALKALLDDPHVVALRDAEVARLAQSTK
ncbi:MAG: hypothetical protein WAM98_09665 [Terriglobales bacterium]